MIILFVSFYVLVLTNAQSPSVTFSTTPITTPRPFRFSIRCSQIQQNEILFDGVCNLEQENIYPKMLEIVSIIDNVNSTMSLNTFLSNYLFENATKYFENKYKTNTIYLQKLNIMKKELGATLAKLKTSLSEVTVYDFLSTLTESKFDGVISEIVKVNSDYLNTLAFNDTNRQNFTCKTDSNFCANTAEMFNIVYTNKFNDYNIRDFLLYLIDNGYNHIKNIFLLAEKREIDGIIQSWNTKGTDQIQMSEVSNLFKKRLINDILYVYKLVKTTTQYRKTTKVITTKTTTVRVKVIDKKAVSIAVIWAIPFVILFLGIVLTIFSASYFYRFKPIETHHHTKSNDNPQFIEMEKQEITKF